MSDELEQALDCAKFAIDNQAWITKIEATDAAESERSVVYKFTPEDSSKIFDIVKSVLSK